MVPTAQSCSWKRSSRVPTARRHPQRVDPVGSPATTTAEATPYQWSADTANASMRGSTGSRPTTNPTCTGSRNGVRRDYEAVLNGLALEHSSGAVEGSVNRMKMIKRQMYGRAGFELLRKRVLLAS
jgi:hypothetical protein